MGAAAPLYGEAFLDVYKGKRPKSASALDSVSDVEYNKYSTAKGRAWAMGITNEGEFERSVLAR